MTRREKARVTGHGRSEANKGGERRDKDGAAADSLYRSDQIRDLEQSHGGVEKVVKKTGNPNSPEPVAK